VIAGAAALMTVDPAPPRVDTHQVAAPRTTTEVDAGEDAPGADPTPVDPRDWMEPPAFADEQAEERDEPPVTDDEPPEDSPVPTSPLPTDPVPTDPVPTASPAPSDGPTSEPTTEP